MLDNKCTKCNSFELYFVKYKTQNNTIQLRKQCFDCGYLLTHNYKHNFVSDFSKIPFVNLNIRNNYYDKSKRKSEIKQVFNDYAHERFLYERNYYRTVYLKSDEWKNKRNLIMEYYNSVCQKCNSLATDVHHITYDNIFKEKFDDLVPLCRSCHEKEHLKKDNETVIINNKNQTDSSLIKATEEISKVSVYSLQSIKLKKQMLIDKIKNNDL